MPNPIPSFPLDDGGATMALMGAMFVAHLVTLIGNFTQAGKTKKTTEVLYDRMDKENPSDNFIFYMTQANNVSVADQTKGRLRGDSAITSVIPKSRILLVKELLEKKEKDIRKGCIVVDYYHERNREYIKELFENYGNYWNNITLVIDEADQGDRIGIDKRLEFIDEIDRLLNKPFHVILVTATSANLCNNIADIGTKNDNRYKPEGIVKRILHENVTKVIIPDVGEEYVDIQWFLENTEERLEKITYPKKIQEKVVKMPSIVRYYLK